MIDKVARRRSGLQACFMLLLGAVMFFATATAAQSGRSKLAEDRVVQPVTGGSADTADCATCHSEVVKNFASNPHSHTLPMHGTNGVTCDICHGRSKAHAESGDTAMVIDLSSATAKEVDEKCQTCHKSRHTNSGLSVHERGNVSCIGCHSIHSAGAPKQLLKLPQPQLCYQCHGVVKAQFSTPYHHKVGEGLIDCTDCHDPHGAIGQRTLQASASQIVMCTKCHTATAGPFVYEHAAVKVEGCTACHYPHGGPNPKMLKEVKVNTICLYCHLPSSTFSTGHPAVPEHIQTTQSPSCINCHSSIHGSNISDLFLKPKQKTGKN